MFSLFNGAVSRTSPSPIGNFLNTPEADKIVAFWCSHPHFLLTLAHANPDIYSRLRELNESGSTGNTTTSENARLVNTVFNYWHRYHFDPTPFGLFAGVAHHSLVGDVSDASGSPSRIKVRIDSTILNDLSSFLSGQSDFLTYFKLYANNTIYKSEAELRYTEKFDSPDLGIVNFELSAAGYSEALNDILLFTADGKYMSQIIAEFSHLVDHPDDLIQFIRQLRENQLLLFEHELMVVGGEPFDNLAAIIERTMVNAPENNPQLEKIHSAIVALKKNIDLLNAVHPDELSPGFMEAVLLNVKETIHATTGKEHSPKSLLSIDSFSGNGQDKSLKQKDATDLTFVINKIASLTNFPYTLTALATFRKKFSARYGDRAVPLAQALDAQKGISYGSFGLSSSNAIVNDHTPLAAQPEQQQGQVETVDRFRFLLYRFIGRAVARNESIISLSKEDFLALTPSESTRHFNDTVQAIVSQYQLDGQEMILLESFGNSSAGNLIARFAYGSSDIEQLLQSIYDYEAEAYEHALVAEVVHVSEPRLGNITQKSISREYEIPILTRSSKPLDQQVRLDDLYVKVIRDEVILFSAKNGKRVIPKLTNAHNYNRNTIPAYQFLGDMAYHNKVPTIDNLLGPVAGVFSFIPRIHYNNILLSRKTWFIESKAIHDLQENCKRNGYSVVGDFMKKYQLDRVVEFISASQNLVVDFDNAFILNVLFNKTHDRPNYQFREVISDSSLQQTTPHFSREYVFALKNTEADTHDKYYPFRPEILTSLVRGKILPGNSSAYCKLYCSRKAYPVFLERFATVAAVMTKAQPGLICFFLPFDDSDFHIRIRVLHTAPLLPCVKELLDRFTTEFQQETSVHKTTYDTYDRELERYDFEGIHLAEKLFTRDSLLVLSLADTQKNHPGTARFLPLLATLSVENILDGFGLSFADKYKLIERIKEGYFIEFGLTSRSNPLYQDVMNKERAFRAMIDAPFNCSEQDFTNWCTACRPLLEKSCADAQRLVQEYRSRNNGLSFSFISGIIHMHMIRLFESEPRLNELFVYYFLYAKLKKQFYRQKQTAVA